MRRFFYHIPHTLKVGQTVALTDDIFHHWCKVLRASVGDTALLFDGTGGEYQVTLTEITKKSALVTVDHFDPIDRTLPFDVTIGLVMSRGERMDYAIQKATELGVSHIQLLTSYHGEVRLKSDQAIKKVDHWQQVAIAACEQCGLNCVPKIRLPIGLDEWLLQFKPTLDNLTIQQDCDFLTDANKPFACTKDKSLRLVLAVPDKANDNVLPIIYNFFNTQSSPSLYLLIGPEGGLTKQEIEQAKAQGFLPWQIGERVLRTETAPVVALSALQTIYSCFKQAVI